MPGVRRLPLNAPWSLPREAFDRDTEPDYTDDDRLEVLAEAMLPLGHVAYTWAALLWLQSRDHAVGIDFRGAALAALIPDLVDKPLSLTLMADSGTSQGLAHTLVVHAAATGCLARAQSSLLPYAYIMNSHLAADQMWKYPRTLLYPFSREFDTWRFMGTPSAMLSAYAEIVTRPAILAVEVLGLLLLAWVFRKGRLYRRGPLLRLIRSGAIASSGEP